MVDELHKYYKNVTQEQVTLYLSLCQTCRNKNKNCFINQAKRSAKKAKNNKPNSKKAIDIENIPKYQIELIDFSKESDNGQKYILVYRNLTSDYIQLRTLKNNDIHQDIVPSLLDIFTIFGIPCILFSTLGLDFLKNLTAEIHQEWPSIKILPGELPNFLTCETERDSLFENIKNRLNEWKKANKTCNWSKGVRFVQLLKNKSCTRTSRTLPHDWLFRSPFSEGLKSLLLESELKNINTEEDLKSFINFEKEGVAETSNDSFEEPSLEKRQKLNDDNSKNLVDFCHNLLVNDLLTPTSSESLYIKEEPSE